MVKLTFIREEDYWLFPLVGLAVIFIGTCLYAGVLQLRLLTGLVGFSLLFFTAYVIRRGYSKRRANLHVFISLSLSVLLALLAYYLTK